MKFNTCIKGIAVGTVITLGAQILHETHIIENEEPQNSNRAFISTPLRNYPPLPDHGPHSQAGIVNTMDGIVAVTTSAAFSFIRAIG
jgi:hypothetical protein